MPNPFCFKCGKPEYKEGLCKVHFAQQKTKLNLPKTIEIEKCSKCELVRLKNKQQPWQPEKYFSSLVGAPVTLQETQKGKDLIYNITLKSEAAGVETKETSTVRIHFDVKVCGVCGRILSSYYEGILQLRGNFPGEVMDLIDQQVDKATDRMVFYRLEKIKEGINLYFGSQRFLKKLSGILSKKYKIKPTETFKQVTIKDGKEIRRRIVALRF